MKKLIIYLLSAVLIISLFIACNKKSPASPQAEQATPTMLMTSTITPTATVTATITATQVCGLKFGSSSDSSNGGSGPSNLHGHKFTATSDVTISDLSIKLSSAAKYCIGIYSDNSGTPGNMLAWSGIKTATAAGWNNANLLIPYTITSGTVFWIVFGSDSWIDVATDDAYTTYYRHETGITEISSIETAGTMPDGGTWLSGTSMRNLIFANGCSY